MCFCIAAIEKKEPEKLISLQAEEEIKRFFDLLRNADNLLKYHEVELEIALKLIQGPLADILTHIGQIALLRRYYNKPITQENFVKAKIQIGNIDRETQYLADQ